MSDQTEDGMGFAGLLPNIQEKRGEEYAQRLQSRLTAAETRIKELEKDRERLDKFNFLAIEHVVKFTRFENGILDLALAKECGEIHAYHGKGSIREAIDLIDCDKLRP